MILINKKKTILVLYVLFLPYLLGGQLIPQTINVVAVEQNDPNKQLQPQTTTAATSSVAESASTTNPEITANNAIPLTLNLAPSSPNNDNIPKNSEKKVSAYFINHELKKREIDALETVAPRVNQWLSDQKISKKINIKGLNDASKNFFESNYLIYVDYFTLILIALNFQIAYQHLTRGDLKDFDIVKNNAIKLGIFFDKIINDQNHNKYGYKNIEHAYTSHLHFYLNNLSGHMPATPDIILKKVEAYIAPHPSILSDEEAIEFEGIYNYCIESLSKLGLTVSALDENKLAELNKDMFNPNYVMKMDIFHRFIVLATYQFFYEGLFIENTLTDFSNGKTNLKKLGEIIKNSNKSYDDASNDPYFNRSYLQQLVDLYSQKD